MENERTANAKQKAKRQANQNGPNDRHLRERIFFFSSISFASSIWSRIDSNALSRTQPAAVSFLFFIRFACIRLVSLLV